MPRRPVSRLAIAITLIAVIGGIAIIVLSVRDLVQRPTDDVVWVRLLAGAAIIGWGVAFSTLGRYDANADDDDAADSRGADDAADSRGADDAADSRGADDAVALGSTPVRPVQRATTVFMWIALGAWAYEVLRSWFGWTVWGSALGLVVVCGLPVLNQFLDRVIARREAGDAPGPENAAG
ncbi:hypothetical protein [Curtobacterium oceanosedimentum]|uniref:hypothetical protein n=1 Tax=Curtobacterium oceanosedimentum TaxID=465820 RepID=UPI001CE1B1D1|nr:hypothetical protein [Curtobacterium oceanosedimentum]MCA5922616.1 hypothetical protein [Curtobacterium oceanosedimentum]